MFLISGVFFTILLHILAITTNNVSVIKNCKNQIEFNNNNNDLKYLYGIKIINIYFVLKIMGRKYNSATDKLDIF